MEFLLDNPIALMNGPLFLVLYGLVISFSILVLVITKSQLDKTDRLPVPPIPPKIDPFEVAFLRGGMNEMARAVVFSLMQKGFIEIKTDGVKSEIKSSNHQPNSSSLSEIENNALSWFYTAREPKDVFDSYGLARQLEQYWKAYEAKLVAEQLLCDDEARNSLNVVKWSVALLIFGLGLYKALAAMLNENFNIVFLIMFGIGGLVISFLVAKIPRITKLGKAYLERLQMVFDDLKYKSQAAYIQSHQAQAVPHTTFMGVDPLMLSVGVFGSGVLIGTVYDDYNKAFQRSQAANGSSCGGSSGCGSSCGSSCSSSDGGGGCGGGCGGCGGGGCS